MKYIYIGLGWIFGIVFLLVGISAVTDSLYAAAAFVLAAALVLPPVRSFAYGRTNRRIATKFRGFTLLVLVVAGSVFLSEGGQAKRQEAGRRAAEEQAAKAEDKLLADAEFFAANKSTILSALTDSLEVGNLRNVFNAAKKYTKAEDPDLVALVAKANSIAAEQERQSKTAAIVVELKGIPAAHYEKNYELYGQLVKLNPTNSAYAEKAEYYEGKAATARAQRVKEEAARRKEQARQQRENQAAAARTEQIETQFSAWNGAHRNLEKYIKSTMHNPDSFKHVETAYWDRGDHLVVRTTFRGTNGFGAVVTNSIKAKVGINGQVLEVLDQF